MVPKVTVAIDDEELHRSHFFARGQSQPRAVERYLAAFGRIRRLQDYMPAPLLAFHDFRRLESFGGRPDGFLDMRHPDAESNRLMLAIMLRDITGA